LLHHTRVQSRICHGLHPNVPPIADSLTKLLRHHSHFPATRFICRGGCNKGTQRLQVIAFS